MALLRQCLNELRTRRLRGHAGVIALAAAPDSVVPPLDRQEIEALLAACAGGQPAAGQRAAAAPGVVARGHA